MGALLNDFAPVLALSPTPGAKRKETTERKVSGLRFVFYFLFLSFLLLNIRSEQGPPPLWHCFGFWLLLDSVLVTKSSCVPKAPPLSLLMMMPPRFPSLPPPKGCTQCLHLPLLVLLPDTHMCPLSPTHFISLPSLHLSNSPLRLLQRILQIYR